MTITAYAILKSHKESIDDLHYLYHRFGDSFAHFNISNDSKGLNTPTNLMDYVNSYEFYLSDWIDKNIKYSQSPNYTIWTPFGSQTLSKISKVIVLDSNQKIYVSTYQKEQLMKLFTDFILAGIHGSNFFGIMKWEDAIENIEKLLPDSPQNKFRMYGEDTIGELFTLGHTFDGSKPDLTFDRLVERFKNATTNRGRTKTITDEALRGKITGGNMFDLSKTGSFKGNIMNEIESKFGISFTDKYSILDLQITIIKEGSPIDVNPYLIIK